MSATAWLPYSLAWYSMKPGSWIFILSKSFHLVAKSGERPIHDMVLNIKNHPVSHVKLMFYEPLQFWSESIWYFHLLYFVLSPVLSCVYYAMYKNFYFIDQLIRLLTLFPCSADWLYSVFINIFHFQLVFWGSSGWMSTKLFYHDKFDFWQFFTFSLIMVESHTIST